jgi:hypothetical protein
VQTIRVDRIVGSVDRASDFDRRFTPRLRESRRRLAALGETFPDGDLPAISVVEVGGLYFVVDGHHRVALTRRRGGEFIEADVVHVESGVELPTDVDLPQLAGIGLHGRFVEESGLDITLSDPAGYGELLDSVKAYGWDRALACRCFPSRAEIAAGWRDEVFEPRVRAMRGASSRRGTEGDTFLAVHRRRRELEATGAPSTDDDAAQALARHRLRLRAA